MHKEVTVRIKGRTLLNTAIIFILSNIILNCLITQKLCSNGYNFVEGFITATLISFLITFLVFLFIFIIYVKLKGTVRMVDNFDINKK